jgi:hypothetical protein
MMFLLLGLGLTQYFSEALTWFWESSPLIKYSGKWLSRDLLVDVFKPSVLPPTELSFLVLKYKMGNTFSCSAYLVTCPMTARGTLKSDIFCLGPGVLLCQLSNLLKLVESLVSTLLKWSNILCLAELL